MNFYALHYRLLLLAVVFLSCSQYHQIRLERKIDIAEFMYRFDQRQINAENSTERITKKRTGLRNLVHLRITKYFMTTSCGSPAEQINNRAVELALDGKISQALILFNEAISEDPNLGAAYNNLGIIYEINGERELSFDMYSKACLLEKGNEIFRKNFVNRSDDALP